jgi:hypothetical protein
MTLKLGNTRILIDTRVYRVRCAVRIFGHRGFVTLVDSTFVVGGLFAIMTALVVVS